MVQTTNQIRQRIEQLVQEAGARLVDVVMRGQRNRTVVEVFVDTEQGITADQLAEISRAVDNGMESESWFSGTSTLNVSSPGLDRPIRFPWQYARHRSREVEVLRIVGEEQVKLRGTIHDVDDDQLVLKAGDGYIAIPHVAIVEAYIQVKF